MENNIQEMIVRQSSMNRAVDLLIAEQTIANNPAKIPMESIKALTNEIEEFVLSVGKETKKEVKKTLVI